MVIKILALGFSRLCALSADTYFNFTCFNVQDPHDSSVGLINGELAIPGNLIRREVFDPVVNQVAFVMQFRYFHWSWFFLTGTRNDRRTIEEGRAAHRRPASRGRLRWQRISH